ncbi:hypothetical protein MU0083_000557 [[Mycobacterium] kokjensenii]|uniref:Transposase n=1 Tax=[Mycobacterium] kokjensenii TaxID=3064287 RepID=A0ABM9L7C9_9MYCO|nr:hypothetical protein [Mycolicibacter sp. MU0083]CAJ1493914.1 hypothetical protein MU0083_000557 [Mycolicibacter sp. MU0083]
MRDEAGARLADLAPGFEYHYDFGDGWIHDVEILRRGCQNAGMQKRVSRCNALRC